MSDQYPDFLPRYLGEPVTPIPDCNNCKWLNITEIEQDRVKRRTIFNEHACLLYGIRVYHKANTRRHDEFIFPCSECKRNNYKHVEER